MVLRKSSGVGMMTQVLNGTVNVDVHTMWLYSPLQLVECYQAVRLGDGAFQMV
jgi:hypothetical protein